VYIASFFVLILVKKPQGDGDKPQGGWHTPYTTLLHTVPLLTILTFGSAVAAYLHVYLLSKYKVPLCSLCTLANFFSGL
jgi:hypothetical protein